MLRSEIRQVVSKAFADLGKIDVIVNHAGYGLFGAAEELSDNQIIHQISTNLLAPIQLIPAEVPHLRAQGEETNYRFVQLWRPGGTSACRCHASKLGLDGFLDALAHELAPFKIGVTIVEPGGAWTNFRFGELNWATGRMALGS